MLLQNKRLIYQTPGYIFGGTLIQEQNNFKKNHRGRFISESEFDKKSSMPLGTEGQYSYVLAQRGGGLATYTDIAGSGSITASQSNGINIEGSLAGTSEMTANANLITSMLADLAGSGTLYGSMVGTVQLAAELAGSGDVVGSLKMFAGMIADLSGSGTLEGTMKGFASMSADIYVNQSEASVQQIVSGVWNAVATEYNTSGSMGEAAQTGGGGGGATPAQIWSYATRTLTESAGLTTEQATQLSEVHTNVDIKSSEIRAGGGGGFSSQAIQTSISNAKREIIQKIEEIPQPEKISLENVESQLNEIVSQNDIAKTEILDRIEEAEIDLRKDVKDVKLSLKEESVSTRQLVRQKSEKVVKYAEKQLDRQEKIEKEIEDTENEIKEEFERMEAEEKEIADLFDQYDKDEEEIKAEFDKLESNT